ncbi:hypothetical protein ZEAMMB73_Zm00001d045114 [Zea mays]|uniref:Uncharacterized protein n=1 Tax=Zea mays TaxID=4577 RepID=A0A1D6NTT3_MAIZE|nr:hypothetical protein ZEAMMB73_Zm00001d045114 [Zea mays]
MEGSVRLGDLKPSPSHIKPSPSPDTGEPFLASQPPPSLGLRDLARIDVCSPAVSSRTLPPCPVADVSRPAPPGQMTPPCPASVLPTLAAPHRGPKPNTESCFRYDVPRPMKWIPTGMDPNSACRVIVKVPAYVELPYQEYHVTENLKFVVDKDTTNWMDFLADLKLKIKHGKEQVRRNKKTSSVAVSNQLEGGTSNVAESNQLQVVESNVDASNTLEGA